MGHIAVEECVVPQADFWFCGSGQDSADWTPGDFLLVRNPQFVGKLIRFGERIDYHGKTPERGGIDLAAYAYWNHAVAVYDETGTLVQATPRGIVKNAPGTYKPTNYVYVHLDVGHDNNGRFHGTPGPQISRLRAREYLDYHVGDEYGWLTVAVGIPINLLTDGHLTLGVAQSEICSGLVAQMTERYGCLYPESAGMIMPADLAYIFDIPAPPGWIAQK